MIKMCLVLVGSTPFTVPVVESLQWAQDNWEHVAAQVYFYKRGLITEETFWKNLLEIRVRYGKSAWEWETENTAPAGIYVACSVCGEVGKIPADTQYTGDWICPECQV